MRALDDVRTDAELIEAIRSGRQSAFGTLFARHRAAAATLARHLSRCQADADDLMSDAFTKVLWALLDGKGPATAFRAYLLTTLRHVAYNRIRRTRKLELVENFADPAAVPPDLVSAPAIDTAIAELERSAAAKAIALLPARWQVVLWMTEVEELPVSEVALRIGLSASATSALAYRARAGLRTAYVQAQLSSFVSDRCRSTAQSLAAFLRDGLGMRARAKIAKHLDDCARCRKHLVQLGDLNAGIPA
ncbi:sigma-70 family RNA polymerase sigma factor [Amycolatopsis sp. cmx-4-61]|uniref:sigma-70 family RNA polymerase sigma factor n=1 Tax=Amycolatopsis sp. cmx-4-61 TaxID=2790937 RepID=UPI0039789096